MSIQPIRIPRKESRVLQYRVLEDGVVKDLTGMTPKLSVKKSASSTAYLIGPVDGVLSATTGEFSVTLTGALTDIDPFRGVFSVVLEDDISSARLTLTPVGGKVFEIFDDIYDG